MVTRSKLKLPVNILKLKIKEIQCKSAIGKCGFPTGGWAINPYIGCAHGCVYCYARFMRRFTNHSEPWGSFIDARLNIAEVLEKQLSSPKYQTGQIFIGTVTDPYQPIEKKYQLTRKILKVLLKYPVSVSILTKSDLILRDLDLLKKLKQIEVSFTINTLDQKWAHYAEPKAPTVKKRLQAAKTLTSQGIKVSAMVGPYWPIFTDPLSLFKEFKTAGITKVFSESLNTVGGNWLGVQKVLIQHYPDLFLQMKNTFFNRQNFDKFYFQAKQKLQQASKEYNIPVETWFAPGHAGKFK